MSDSRRSTRYLLALLPQASAGPTLDIGSEGGALALESGGSYVHISLAGSASAHAAGVPITVHNDILPAGPFGTICFDAHDYEPGLAAETVCQAASRLSPGGVLLTTARKADVATAFRQVVEHGEALVARQPLLPAELPPPDRPVVEAEFGGQNYRLQSAPGVFSPRRMDEGTAFMLSLLKPGPGARFLDLGCGIGIVSRVASEQWGCQVTAVDVNARALRLTAINAPQAEVLASDGFGALASRTFDLIASNPPYHVDFAVARTFIEGAHAHLAIGGLLFLVVKRTDWYLQKVRSIFGGCRIETDGEYTVLIAEKREARPAKAAPGAPATTKKHEKRMALTKGKRRR